MADRKYVDPKYPHWIPGDNPCTLCSRRLCLWQSEGPDILDDWMEWMKRAKKLNKRGTVELRKKYIYEQIIRRIYNCDADIEPPACVVAGVELLPKEVTWSMVYPRDNYQGIRHLTCD
jgi:hypothetical protein